MSADGYWQIGSPLKKDPNLRVWISTERRYPPPTSGSGSCLAATTPAPNMPKEGAE